MSFVKKAVKKVFKAAKKVVKKVWKPALIAGATLFTAGVGTVGFGAFSGVSSLGGFLGATGSTIAAGGSSLLGAFGLGQGLTAGQAAATGGIQGTNIFNGALAQGLGLGRNVAAAGQALNTGQQAVNTALGAAGLPGTTGAGVLGGAVGGSNFLSKVGQSIAGLTQGSTGKMLLFSGITSGIQSFMASREAARERKIDRRRNFFGGPQRGGTPDSGIEFPDFSRTASATNQGQFAPASQQAAQQAALASAEPQQPQQSVFPQSPFIQPGNLDLIGPEQEQQGLFAGVV